jgi:hypothetical protein
MIFTSLDDLLFPSVDLLKGKGERGKDEFALFPFPFSLSKALTQSARVIRFSEREAAPTVTVAIDRSNQSALIENPDISGAVGLFNQQFPFGTTSGE